MNQDLEGAVVAKSKPSPLPTAPPTTTVGLSSLLETTINQLSDRLRAVENQLSLVVADIKKLKALNGMDASDYSSLKSVPLLTRDDVSQHRVAVPVMSHFNKQVINYIIKNGCYGHLIQLKELHDELLLW